MMMLWKAVAIGLGKGSFVGRNSAAYCADRPRDLAEYFRLARMNWRNTLRYSALLAFEARWHVGVERQEAGSMRPNYRAIQFFVQSS
jgi:hypothetical protein